MQEYLIHTSRYWPGLQNGQTGKQTPVVCDSPRKHRMARNANQHSNHNPVYLVDHIPYLVSVIDHSIAYIRKAKSFTDF